MKLSTKFLLIMTAITAACTVVCSVVLSNGLSRIRKNENIEILSVLSAVIEKYPNLSSREIAEIINSGGDAGKAEKVLRRYGIDSDSFIVPNGRDTYREVMITVLSVCLGTGLLEMLLISIYGFIKTKREKRLTKYLARVNSGDYSMSFRDLTEDNYSVLSDEIYKTTMMLRENSEMLKRDKENLKDSLSDISHQLKTPITSIMIMLDNILEGDMPDELRNEFLCDIKSSSEHICFLIQSLLTLSKLDADAVEFRNDTVKLKSILQGSVDSTQAIAEAKGVNVSLECGDIGLVCDRKWVGEAITNIVKNCIEHTPRDGSVMLLAEETAMYIKVDISDTGCGIDKKDLPHVFERFYKGGGSDENSVGIGLALAKSIIEKSGGYITADSEKGEGSRFTIKFFKGIK